MHKEVEMGGRKQGTFKSIEDGTAAVGIVKLRSQLKKKERGIKSL